MSVQSPQALDPELKLAEGFYDEARGNFKSLENWRRAWVVIGAILGVLATAIAATAGIGALPAVKATAYLTAGLAFGAAVVAGLTTLAAPTKRAADDRATAIAWLQLSDVAEEFIRHFDDLTPEQRDSGLDHLQDMRRSILAGKNTLSAEEAARIVPSASAGD